MNPIASALSTNWIFVCPTMTAAPKFFGCPKRRHCLLVIAAIEEIRKPAKLVYGTSEKHNAGSRYPENSPKMNQGTLF